MMRYHGKHGIIGAIAFGLTGIIYRVFGVSAKWFGKILFFIFLKGIPMLIKGFIKLIFNIF